MFQNVKELQFQNDTVKDLKWVDSHIKKKKNHKK